MPSREGWNTVEQAAHDYLRAAHRENGHFSYRKRRPVEIARPSYLEQLVRRQEETGQLRGFADLIEALRGPSV